MKKILIGLVLIGSILLAEDEIPTDSRLKGYVIGIVASEDNLKYGRGSYPSFVIVDNNGKLHNVPCRTTKVVENMPLILEKGITGRPLYELFKSYKDENNDTIVYEIK